MRDKNISFWESGVGSVPLLQDHNCAPHVTMHKVNPEVGPVFYPPPDTPLPGTGVVTELLVRIPNKSGLPRGVEWGGVGRYPPPATPVPSLAMGTVPTSSVAPEKSVPSL